jgi:mannose-6-phosphate isomerase-like protein (cupin superfamily)
MFDRLGVKVPRSTILCDEFLAGKSNTAILRSQSIRGPFMSKVNIAEKFAKITEYWKPYIGAELNGQLVKFDKLKGEFVFHHHDHEDEMFLVVKGRFRMEFRDRHEWIEEGEFIVVPRGVEHRPVADEECWILLFEPASTLNTGNVVNERTLPELERV